MATSQNNPDQGAANSTSNITDISHEPVLEQAGQEMEIQEVQELEAVPIETQIKNELAKFNLADSVIDNMRRKCMKLKITGLDDKAGYKKVKEAWQVVRNTRLKVGKKHTEIKADFLVLTRAMDGEKNRLTERLSPIEEYLKKQLDDYDQKKEDEKNKVENELNARLELRVKELIEHGVTFNGSFYSIGDFITLDVVTIKAMTPEVYTDLLGKIDIEHAKIVEAAKQKELEAEKEKETQAQLKKDNERIQGELKEKQDKIDKQLAQIKDARTKNRVKDIEALGTTYNYSLNQWEFKNTFGKATITRQNVEDMEDEEFAPVEQTFIESVNSLKEKQDEQEKIDQRTTARGSQLNGLGMKVNMKGEQYLFQNTAGSTEIDVQQMNELTDEDWGILVNAKTGQIKTLLEKAEEIKLLNLRTISRAQQLTDLFGLSLDGDQYCRFSKFVGVANMIIDEGEILNKDADQWGQFIELLKEQFANILGAEKDAQAVVDQNAEAERLTKLSDKQLLEEFFSKFFGAARPEFKTDLYKNALNVFEGMVSEARAQFKQAISE